MLFAVGAASSAIDLLSSLTQGSSTSSGKIGIVPAGSTTFSVADTTASPPIAPPSSAGCSTCNQSTPTSFNTLLAAQTQSQPDPTSRSAALQDLFSLLDANGDGKISKSEFENALGAGGTNLQAADNVFAQLDKNGDGSISLDELSQGLGGAGHHHHHHHVGGGKHDGGADALAQALQGATSSTATNADGSTSTTITYADGSKVTLTQPVSSSSTASPSANAAASYNFTERLIERQAQAIAANAQSSVSLSA